ncbi:ACP S-malonyltransferase [Sinimarinibacterium sp. NLF-5-8]|uniref:ACP S-malonyltransferase n=1 Tax=Sinimarinibacterium sp. NLF-5-8 TaxID=2698684 RepID=UPI001EE49646|nr:ACP S-malonyltransferase [Sinimarinibacterium sp. NLF-5-8]
MNYAMMFPGQGSQTVGMLGEWASATIDQTFEQASDVLGWDMATLVRQGPAEELNRTERTQPVMLAASIALWRVWQQQGVPQPSLLAGHSLGEYSALVAAESLRFEDALKLVELRGQLMQSAVPEGTGGMAAVIGLDDAQVAALCAAYPGAGVLEPANYNSPGQVVVAGARAAVDWVLENAKAHGARMAVAVAMSVPSHCSLMRQAAQQLDERLQSLSVEAPKIPVIHNLDACSGRDAQGIRDALREQLYRPVLWTASVERLGVQGIEMALECGPGKVLCGLVKRINKQLPTVALEDPAGMEKAQALMRAAAV